MARGLPADQVAVVTITYSGRPLAKMSTTVGVARAVFAIVPPSKMTHGPVDVGPPFTRIEDVLVVSEKIHTAPSSMLPTYAGSEFAARARSEGAPGSSWPTGTAAVARSTAVGVSGAFGPA